MAVHERRPERWRRAGSVTVRLRGGAGQWFADISMGILWGYFLVASWGQFAAAFTGLPGLWALTGLFTCVSGVALVAQRREIPRLIVTPGRLLVCDGRHEWRLSRIWHEFDRQQVESVDLHWYPGGSESLARGAFSIHCRDGQQCTVINVSSLRRLRRARQVLLHHDWPVPSSIRGDPT